jgi:hypothetical protein
MIPVIVVVLLLAEGPGQSIVYAPSALKPPAESLGLQSDLGCPVEHTKSCSLERDIYGPSGVSALLSCGGPATISGFVTTSVINPVNRMNPARAFPHITKECLKRVSPSTTNRDTSAAVVRKARVFWFSASADHQAPNIICRSVCLSVGNAERPVLLAAKASAAFRATANQVAGPGHSFISAFAPTVNHWPSGDGFFGDDREPKELLSGLDEVGGHNSLVIWLRLAAGQQFATRLDSLNSTGPVGGIK